MKLREDLKQYLTIEQVGDCWRCGKKFQTTDLRGTSTFPEIECQTCGLIIEVHSRLNKMFGWLIIGTITAFAFGMALVALL